jgi:hypothetical protein
MKLTEAQIERLNCLQEECAEIVQAASKILRFGYENKHPRRPDGQTNREHLEEEIGNLTVILDFMVQGGDVEEEKIYVSAEEKKKTIGKYLRFQE